MSDENASSQDRNLPASQRKIERAREQGQLPRSRDLAHFGVLAAAGALLAGLGPWAARWLQALVAEALHFDARLASRPQAMAEQLAVVGGKGMLVALGVGAVLSLAAVASHLASGGWNWTLQPLAPKFSKINPFSGLKRLFSGQQLMQAGKAVLLALLVGAVGAWTLSSRMSAFVGAMTVPLPQALAYAGQQFLLALGGLGVLLALFAVIDVPWQRQMLARRLRMTREEMKKENKEVEGNMEIKAKLRARMRELATKRMMAAVPTADLVVMNPTHYAVALKYEEGTMSAPRVVAKGADLLAMRIRDLASESKVPVLQSPMLARALYAHAELDREIPAALFAAVAQVLAYVYQLRAALAGRGAAPTEAPDPQVPLELDPHHKPVPSADLEDDLT